MTKIMLVIENHTEGLFLNKLLKKLGYHVMSISPNEQKGDFFPDIVLASALGKTGKTLAALAKIKESRGIPKIVFVRPKNDKSSLSEFQKKIVDGLLYSPVDPFKLLEILSKLTGEPLNELKEKYRNLILKDSKRKPAAPKKEHGSVMIMDTNRRMKYDLILQDLKKKNEDHPEFDAAKMKKIMAEQPPFTKEELEARKLQEHFVKVLYTATPKKRTGTDD